MSNIELLGRYGDPMERAIVRQSMTELGGILAPYADIWRAYVKPARIGTGEILNPECMLFGGNHYTALIRAHNALGFYKEIIAFCEVGNMDDDGGLLLSLQSTTSGFWWSLGALVDNLGQAIENFPDSTVKKMRDGGLKLLRTERKYLKYLYDRRTQLIHSRIVPIAMDNGNVKFDYGYLDDEKKERRPLLPEATEWKSEFHTRDELAQFYRDRWAETKAELTCAWHFVRKTIDGYAASKSAKFNWQKLIIPPEVTTIMTACSANPPGPSGTGRNRIGW